MTKSTPRPNNTRLRDTTCHRCHLPTLTGWDDALMAQQVKLHPAVIDHNNAIAALHLGHNVTVVNGTHETGFRASHSWMTWQADHADYTRSERNKKFMVWHQCGNLPRLAYKPIPTPKPEPEEFDLFNQPPADDLPPY